MHTPRLRAAFPPLTDTSDDALRDVPVLLLTAKAGDEAEVEGLGAGAEAYVEKPFSMATLRARIQNLIESRAALRDQYCTRSPWRRAVSR